MKDRDNEKGKLWEKRRRDRLKESFHKLGELLPHYDPSKAIPQQEILDRATQFVKELRLSNSRLILNQQTQADEKSKLIQELQDEVNKLILRVKQLTALLNQADISIPAGPCLKQLGKRKLKWSDKLAADDVETHAKRKATTEDVETTKENGAELPSTHSDTYSDMGSNVSTSTPLRETNGCTINPSTSTTTTINGDKEDGHFSSNGTSSTTISVPVSIPLQMSANSPTQNSASIQALKPVTFTIPMQSTPIFLTSHSLTPISTMMTPISRFTTHRILPKPNDPNNIPKLPILRVRQPNPVIKKKRRRRQKKSTNENNSKVTASDSSQNQPPSQNSITSQQSLANIDEPVDSTLDSEPMTLVYEPNDGSEDTTKNLPEPVDLISENELVKTNLVVDQGLVESEKSCDVETTCTSTNNVEEDIRLSQETNEHGDVDMTSKEMAVTNETTNKDEERASNANSGGDDSENNQTTCTVVDSHETVSLLSDDREKEITTDESSTTEREIMQESQNKSIIMVSVENQNEVKTNSMDDSAVTGKDAESSEQQPALPDVSLHEKLLETSSEINSSSGNNLEPDESLVVEPKSAVVATVNDEIEMGNQHSDSLQEIVDNLMEAPPVTNQRQLEAGNSEDLTVLSNVSEEAGSVSNEKISECIARSIDLIDQPEELMELSADWGETDVNSPKSPISPTQMFLSMFPLLPRDSIISSSEATQNSQQQVHKQTTSFTGAKSSSSSFYIDSMLPDADDHFNSRNSILVSTSVSNSTALISSNSNCNNMNFLTTPNLLSLTNTSSETKSSGTTCLAMIPPVSSKRVNNTENSENLNPFCFHLPPKPVTTPASVTVSSENKDSENSQSTSIKNNVAQVLADSSDRNLHLNLSLNTESSRERITDLDSSFPIFSSFMNNLSQNSTMSCNKTVSNICTLNNLTNNINQSNNDQRSRKEADAGNWTPYEYPTYSMASITTMNKNTEPIINSNINHFIQPSSSAVRHSSNSNNNNSSDQNKPQQSHQNHNLLRTAFDTSSSPSNAKSVSNTNKACHTSDYGNQLVQKNSHNVHSNSTSVMSSRNLEQDQQNLQNTNNTHTYKPYMQTFHSQALQSQSHSNFNAGSNSNQHAQAVPHQSSSLMSTPMYGSSSASDYDKNQEHQPDLFRPLSVPTSTDFHNSHHLQQSQQHSKQSNNNDIQTYTQHNVLHSTSLNVNLSVDSNPTGPSQQSKSHHTSKSQNSRSNSSRSQTDRNNSAVKTVSSYTSNSTSRSSKTSSSMSLHSPYTSQFPSTNSTVSSGARSGRTTTSSNQTLQNCSRTVASSSNSKRNYNRGQAQPQNSSIVLSNQNSVHASVTLDFPPHPAPVPSTTDFAAMGNHFYENILPQTSAQPFAAISHHHHSKSQTSSSRHQPFYLPEVPPVQNFDFIHHHQPHSITTPMNPTVPPLAPPPAVTASSQQLQKNTLSSPSAHRNQSQTTTAFKGTTTTPYNYFSTAACQPVSGYASSSTITSGLNNTKTDHMMSTLTDSHNNSVYDSSSTLNQQQQRLPSVQHHQLPPPIVAPPKKSVQSQSQQSLYPNANANSQSQHLHSHHQQHPQRQPTHGQVNVINNLPQSVPSRPVNWMTDPLPLPQPPSSCNRKDNSSSSSIPNPFSVSKLVGNTNNGNNNNNNNNSSNNSGNNNNYCVEGLIRKPSSSDWNDFHLGTSGHAHVQSMSSHVQPPPFVTYQAQPDYGNYANFSHHPHHHYTNAVAMNPPGPGHFVHHFEHANSGASSTGNLHNQQHHGHSANNANNQGIAITSHNTDATISSHSHHHHHHQQQQQHGTSSVLNFNLSSIFPEMNDKRNNTNSNNANNNSNVCNYYATSSTGNISSK